MTRVGTKKTHHLIKPELVKLDIKCGRDKLNDILRSEGMHIRKKKNYMRTTNSYHRFKKYPNLIKYLQGFTKLTTNLYTASYRDVKTCIS